MEAHLLRTVLRQPTALVLARGRRKRRCPLAFQYRSMTGCSRVLGCWWYSSSQRLQYRQQSLRPTALRGKWRS